MFKDNPSNFEEKVNARPLSRQEALVYAQLMGPNQLGVGYTAEDILQSVGYDAVNQTVNSDSFVRAHAEETLTQAAALSRFYEKELKSLKKFVIDESPTTEMVEALENMWMKDKN